MKKNKLDKLVVVSQYFLTIIIASAAIVGIVYAGSLTPPSGTPASTGYTLGDIYTRLTTNATAGSHSLAAPGGAPAPTFHTLTEIYNAIPTISSSTVKQGTTILGVAGSLGQGAMATNQSICYDVSGTVITCVNTGTYPGQDGYYKKGIAISYTDNGDGTVKDNGTGLTWQKQDNGATMTWAAGLQYCANNTAALPGSGWRLPNINELLSLVDYARAAPTINSVFTSTQSNSYWAATTYQGGTYYAWYVVFSYGYASYNNKTPSYYVRCVRG